MLVGLDSTEWPRLGGSALAENKGMPAKGFKQERTQSDLSF